MTILIGGTIINKPETADWSGATYRGALISEDPNIGALILRAEKHAILYDVRTLPFAFNDINVSYEYIWLIILDFTPKQIISPSPLPPPLHYSDTYLPAGVRFPRTEDFEANPT